MKSKNIQFAIVFVSAGLLLIGLFVLSGCKKKSEPAAPIEAGEAASAAIEQKTCPIMGGTIDKNIYTEYKGKRVYFCCAGCQEKFKANPEKYVAKLPQFKQ